MVVIWKRFWITNCLISTRVKPVVCLHKSCVACKAIFEYFEYLFVSRGCKAFNWFVTEKNTHAHELYEKFIEKYFGHLVGKRHYGQMAYNGEVSDIYLYEATCDEYFEWKEK